MKILIQWNSASAQLSSAQLSSAQLSSAQLKYNFKLFQFLCLLNSFIIYKIYSLFIFLLGKRSKARLKARFQRNKRKRISKYNRKNIFSICGKFINFLHKEFLYNKIVYLFKYFYNFSIYTFIDKYLINNSNHNILDNFYLIYMKINNNLKFKEIKIWDFGI